MDSPSLTTSGFFSLPRYHPTSDVLCGMNSQSPQQLVIWGPCQKPYWTLVNNIYKKALDNIIWLTSSRNDSRPVRENPTTEKPSHESVKSFNSPGWFEVQSLVTLSVTTYLVIKQIKESNGPLVFFILVWQRFLIHYSDRCRGGG